MWMFGILLHLNVARITCWILIFSLWFGFPPFLQPSLWLVVWEPVLNFFFLLLWQVTKLISCYFRSTFESNLWMWLPLFKTLSPGLESLMILPGL